MSTKNLITKKGLRLKILLGLLITVIMTFGMALTASAATYSLKAYYPGDYNATTGVPANGIDAVTIQFTCSDGYGEHPVTFTSSPNTLQLTNANGLKTGVGGSVSFPVASTVAGTFTITAQYCTLNGTPISGATASCTVNFTKLPDPDVSVIAYTITRTPNGTANIKATVTRSGWGLSNVPVTFTTDGGNLLHKGTLSPTTTQYTNYNGEAYTTLTMPVQDTAKVIATLSADYGSKSNYCTVTFSDGDGSGYYTVSYNADGSPKYTPAYTVTYVGNGATGSAPTDSNHYVQGASVPVLGTGSLSNPGYSFAGWKHPNGTVYTPNNSFTMGTSDVTLTAQWTLIPTYTVTYNGNGATGSAPNDGTRYVQGTNVTVLDKGSLTNPGYTFAGWTTNAAGSGTVYTAGNIYTMGAANVTFYAQWTLIPTYTVTYVGNGATGSAPTDGTRYVQGASVTVLGADSLSNPGYTFAGWTTNAAGSGTVYTAGNIYTMDAANVTFYAQWTLIPTYTVTYVGNGATGSAPNDDTRYVQGANVTVLDQGSLTNPGYTFAGWTTNAAGSGTTYTAGNIYTMGAANVTFYAQWTKNPTIHWTVTFDGQGGSPALTTILVRDGDPVTQPDDPTRSADKFDGWYTSTNYDTQFDFNTPITKDITLYARWTSTNPGGESFPIFSATPSFFELFGNY